jgi:hypothetical protein
MDLSGVQEIRESGIGPGGAELVRGQVCHAGEDMDFPAVQPRRSEPVDNSRITVDQSLTVTSRTEESANFNRVDF